MLNIPWAERGVQNPLGNSKTTDLCRTVGVSISHELSLQLSLKKNGRRKQIPEVHTANQWMTREREKMGLQMLLRQLTVWARLCPSREINHQLI